jgi:hypothetical protein
VTRRRQLFEVEGDFPEGLKWDKLEEIDMKSLGDERGPRALRTKVIL